MTATELSPQSPGIEPALSPLTDGSAVPDSTGSPQSPCGPDGVLCGRERIDALDAQIAELVKRRIDVSRQIQASRIADGGRRVDLRRETEIIARYSTALGRPGTAIAMALLELGRGRA